MARHNWLSYGLLTAELMVILLGSFFQRGCRWQGQFDKTMIIAMGCYSFMRNDLAEAFIQKGAACYVGWSGLVNLDYTDTFTKELLQNLLEKELPLKKAIDLTSSTIGPEPDHKTEMLYYPEKFWDKKLYDIIH